MQGSPIVVQLPTDTMGNNEIETQIVEGSPMDLECLSRQLSQIPSLLHVHQESALLQPVANLLVGPNEAKIYVHTSVLLARCPYVSMLLNSSLKEAQAGLTDFRFPDLTVEGVRACVDFMYSASFAVSMETVVHIIEAAKYLLMEGIENHCAEYIAQYFTNDTVMDLLESALELSCAALQEKVLSYIAKHARMVFKDVCLSSRLSEVSCEQMLAVLSRPDLGATEEEVYRFTLSWLDAHSTHPDVTQFTDVVLDHISYAAMSMPFLRDRLSSPGRVRSESHREWLAEGLQAKQEPHVLDSIPQHRRRRVPTPAAVLHGSAGFCSLHPLELSLESGARWDGNGVLDLSCGDSHAVIRDPKGGILNGTCKFFVEAWVKPCYLPHKTAYEGPIVSKHGSGAGWELRLGQESIQFLLTLRKQQMTWHEVVTCHRDVQPGRWIHVAGSFDGEHVCLYVDGQRVSSRQPDWNNHQLQQNPAGAQVVGYAGDVTLGRGAAWRDRKLICQLAGVRIFTDQIPQPTDFLPPYDDCLLRGSSS